MLKEIKIPCPYHRQFDREIGYFNSCSTNPTSNGYCNSNFKLVCAKREGNIIVNQEWEQECLNCKEKEVKDD